MSVIAIAKCYSYHTGYRIRERHFGDSLDKNSEGYNSCLTKSFYPSVVNDRNSLMV